MKSKRWLGWVRMNASNFGRNWMTRLKNWDLRIQHYWIKWSQNGTLRRQITIRVDLRRTAATATCRTKLASGVQLTTVKFVRPTTNTRDSNAELAKTRTWTGKLGSKIGLRNESRLRKEKKQGRLHTDDEYKRKLADMDNALASEKDRWKTLERQLENHR